MMENPMGLCGRNIMVTGASSGIGRSTAILLSRLGANVLMVSRDEEKLRETLCQMAEGEHSLHISDLSNPAGVKDLMENACGGGRKLSGLVHSAGISATIPLQFLKTDDLQRIMSVNFYSFIELVRHFSMRKFNDNGGSVVAISSISGKVGARGLTAYCASKGALESAIRALALELAPKNIRINSVAPGMIKTRIYDGLKDVVNNDSFEAELKKRQILGLGDPSDVAEAAAFLLSDAAKFITGTSMTVDGGYLAH
jgi:NAD(P)-dependent dehydrogenase (short-subunit alcohol dehydrogenase family)